MFAREKHNCLGRLNRPRPNEAATVSGTINGKSVTMYPEDPLGGIRVPCVLILLILLPVFEIGRRNQQDDQGKPNSPNPPL